MLQTIPQAAFLFISIAVLGYLSFAQELSQCILTSNLTFAVLYFAFHQIKFLQPEKALSRIECAEWSCRQVSNIHAIIMIVGAILCFMQWDSMSLEEGFVGNPTLLPVFFCAVSMGYLQWDLFWQIYHMDEYHDLSALIHHVLYLAICHYNMTGCYFCRPFAWLVFGELSTPFLNQRWFYAVADLKESQGYVVSSMMFGITFLMTRVAGYSWGFFDLWKHKDLWIDLPIGLKFVVFGLHLGFALNLFWGIKVWSALVRIVKKQMQPVPKKKDM
jgi:hypothetical protein